MDPSCRQKGVGAHVGRSARIETKAESICLLLYRELKHDLNARFRYFPCYSGSSPRKMSDLPMDRLIQRKNIINTVRITPLPVSQNPESKTGNVQEKVGVIKKVLGK